eukprot:16432212-Heterocapsa_arctica.AAC.1
MERRRRSSGGSWTQPQSKLAPQWEGTRLQPWNMSSEVMVDGWRWRADCGCGGRLSTDGCLDAKRRMKKARR